MPIPSLTLTIKDPGLGLVELAASTPLVIGVCSAGTVNALVSIRSPTDAVTQFGQGPAVEDACRILSETGGPVLMSRVNGSVVGTNSAVVQVGGGPVVTLAGAPFDSYDGKIEIVAGGALGVGKFKYALDAHGLAGLAPTFSADTTIPTGGTFVIPNTNITVTFAAGTYVLATTYTWTSTEPYYSVVDLDTLFDIVRLLPNQWRLIHLAGKPPTAASAATMAAGLATELSTEQGLFRYARGFIDAGRDTTTNALTSFAAFSDLRTLVAYGDVARVTLKPFAGWGTPRRSVLAEFSARAALSQISTHLGRVASGSLPGVLHITHDEFQNQILDAARFSTLRTWPGRPGFYITRARLMSALGSDFKYTHNGFVMDVACETVVNALQEFANKSFRTVPGTGTIDPLDAEDVKAAVLRQLRAQLTEPINQEGKRGHVSSLNFTVDLNNNLLTTGQINTEVAIQPLGYGEFFTVQIGFALTTGA